MTVVLNRDVPVLRRLRRRSGRPFCAGGFPGFRWCGTIKFIP